MSKAPDNAYRAVDPQAVEDSLRRFNERRQEFFDAVKAYGDELGHEIAIMGHGDNSLFVGHLMGEWTPNGKYERPESGRITEREKVADIPPGWHFYKKDHEVRPYKGGRDAASKAVRARVEELNKMSPSGLRTWLRREFDIQRSYGSFASFAFEPLGDDFYVLTATPRPGTVQSMMVENDGAWEGNEHFEKIPMSAYWLAKEQHDHEQAS